MTAHAVVAVNAAVQLQYLLTSGHLMQTVDVLRDHSGQLSLLLQLRQRPVRLIRFRGGSKHLVPVEAKEFLRPTHKEGMA